ncbi:cephalosporin hydroxylase family protein [Aquihabitans daechungensis]|uniref:cephalosporin hydroxylase family protein n=1 Tax=Aquihabitans daechungensis TaxID=1052257 RepID=UPI003BA1E677
MSDPTADDRDQFEQDKRRQVAEMAADPALNAKALDLVVDADRYGYSYQWTWLGLPIIQMPPDIVALQEVIWATKPQVIIETGVARGGSVIMSSSLLELIGEGEVVAVDIDIRAHNRAAIEEHPLAHRVHLIQGSSVDPDIVEAVRARTEGAERVMVVLDSNHTHEHVLAELEAYAPMVTPGQYLIVADTVVEHIPVQEHRPRPWGPGDNPMTALDAYVADHPEFEPDRFTNDKLLMTSSPGGYLRRTT